MERKVNWMRIALAALIATFLFTFGLLLGYITKGIISTNSVSLEESVRNDIINLETLYLLEGTFPCNSEILDITSQKLDSLGELITVLEVKKGKHSKDVLELKKLYTVLETRHFLLTNTRKENCGEDYDIFLYFYSNRQECKGEVEKSSFVLTYTRNKYDQVRVYSFDIDLNSEIISALKAEYSIQGCSGVVLNNNPLNFKIENADQIEPLL